MLEVTLSEQHQVAIPEEILESLNLKAGQKFSVVIKGDLISLIPKSSLSSFRGILKGANTDNIRDRNDKVELITEDDHVENLPGTRYFAKQNWR